MICPTVFGAWWRTWLMKTSIGRNRLLYHMWYAAKGAHSVQLRTDKIILMRIILLRIIL